MNNDSEKLSRRLNLQSSACVIDVLETSRTTWIIFLHMKRISILGLIQVYWLIKLFKVTRILMIDFFFPCVSVSLSYVFKIKWAFHFKQPRTTQLFILSEETQDSRKLVQSGSAGINNNLSRSLFRKFIKFVAWAKVKIQIKLLVYWKNITKVTKLLNNPS